MINIEIHGEVLSRFEPLRKRRIPRGAVNAREKIARASKKW
jgi:hypothetical protein